MQGEKGCEKICKKIREKGCEKIREKGCEKICEISGLCKWEAEVEVKMAECEREREHTDGHSSGLAA